MSRRAIFEPGGTLKDDSGIYPSQVESIKSSAVMENIEEMSTEKRKRGAISPAKRQLIRTIKKN